MINGKHPNPSQRRYFIHRDLGRGAMGTVHLARVDVTPTDPRVFLSASLVIGTAAAPSVARPSGHQEGSVHRRHRAWTALVLLWGAHPDLHAQESPRTAVDVGATILFLADPLGGATPAVALGATVDALSRSRWGAGLGARIVGLVSGAVATPDCVPGGRCIEYRSLHSLFMAVAYGFSHATGRQVRLTYGVGWMQAAGAKGFDEGGTGTVEAGVHYTPRRGRRTAPRFGVSVVHGLRATGGVRTLVLPTVGLRF
jgi:hypothetical protein